jgi:hypothetical protein
MQGGVGTYGCGTDLGRSADNSAKLTVMPDQVRDQKMTL